jgi:ABC transporter with metal-binding/Fe-S-binding domain ATP-binding protein
MKLGILFSGGKDSTLALHKAALKEEVTCLITLVSRNKESYMFHTPNVSITGLQAEALGLPLVQRATQGEKESELVDLEGAIAQAVRDYGIEGVVSGAVDSVYQAERVQRICHRLNLWSFNPLWKRDQAALLRNLVQLNIRSIISGVFAYPLDSGWIGKEIDAELISRLLVLASKYGFSPAGEGGEIETTVLDAPLFKKRIEILGSHVEASGSSSVFVIDKSLLVPK